MTMILNGNEIHDIDTLIENLDDRTIIGYYQDLTLYTFLDDCFYTDEAERIKRIDTSLNDDAIYKAIVKALTDSSEIPSISFGKSDLKKEPDPDAPTLTYKEWTNYLKKKSRKFREDHSPVYEKGSKALLKRLGIENDRSYLIHDDSLFHNGKYGFAVMIDGIMYREPFFSIKPKFISFEKIRKGGGLVRNDCFPSLDGETLWISIPDRFLDDAIKYFNEIAKKQKEYGLMGRSFNDES